MFTDCQAAIQASNTEPQTPVGAVYPDRGGTRTSSETKDGKCNFDGSRHMKGGGTHEVVWHMRLLVKENPIER